MKQVIREEGVSEVIGTILVLAITVILFSTVFVYVSRVPPAKTSEQITVYPQIYYDGNSHVLYENITDQSGSILNRDAAYLMVFVNGTEYTRPLSSLPLTGPNGNDSNLFKPGYTIQWNSASLGIKVSNNSSFRSMLFYKPSNQVLWQSQSYILDQFSITASYVDPSPIAPEKLFTIVVQILTLDPSSLSVYVNLTSLYGISMNESMSLFYSTGNQYSFYFSGIAPSITPSGSYATVYAKSGNASESNEVYLS